MKNKTILITGAANGLGKSLTEIFAKNGYEIILSDIDKKNLEKVKKGLIKNNVKCSSISGDLTKRKILDEIEKISKDKKIDILINNAGLHCPNINFEKISDETIKNIIDVNLISPIQLTKRIYKFFIKQKSGLIVNINSLSGIKNHKLRTIYSASKWGLRGFSESLRIEARDNDIKIIDIYPGRIKTKPEFESGMNPDKVAQKIFYEIKDRKNDNIIIDGVEYD